MSGDLSRGETPREEKGLLLVEEGGIPPATPSGRRGGGRREPAGSFFALLSLLIICATIAVVFQILAETFETFLAIAPLLALALGIGTLSSFLLWRAWNFLRLVRELKAAHPLISYETFRNDEENVIGQWIRSGVAPDELEALLESEEAFYAWLERELPTLLIGKNRRVLRRFFEKEWYRFKMGVSPYQEQIETGIEAEWLRRATSRFPRLLRGTLPRGIDDYKLDEAAFVSFMMRNFFRILRQYNRQNETFRDLERERQRTTEESYREKWQRSRLEEEIEAECYAYFEYGQGAFYRIMKEYFAEHPEIPETPANFRKILFEHFPAFERKRRIMEAVDAKYLGKGKDSPRLSPPEEES